MSSEQRVSIKTSVPRYQKEAWTEHADALDMSQSEYLATMIQAGRRVFEDDLPKTPSADANPQGDGLEAHVLGTLSIDSHRSFEELLDSLAEELDAKLQSLIQAGRVQFSGQHGGYVIAGGHDDDG